MDKWFRLLAEERASVAGLRKSMSDLLDKGPQTDGSPYDENDDEKPRLKGKKNRNQVSAPPGAPGGGSAGAPGPSLEEAAQDTRPAVEPTPFKSAAQRRYKRSRQRGDIYSTRAGHKNFKKVSGPFTTDTERAGTNRLRFEDVDPESFDKNEMLEPDFWQNKRLDPRISARLQRIAADFIEGLEVPADIVDVRFTGSLANYNWSRYSDIDLHIVVDFSKIDDDADLVKAYFDSERMRWNDRHDIKINGFEVEIYVEDIDEEHRSSGVYSIMEDAWIAEPDPSDIKVPFDIARLKSDDIIKQANMIEKFIKEKPRAGLNSIERLKSKIRNMRRHGLESDEQEYSAENIAFKILRREEILQKLNDLKYNAYDQIMSMVLK
tara:strand:+ start:532 stop:1665 length:1134 start_codon:yes stop_codon:yes gene_type:complete